MRALPADDAAVRLGRDGVPAGLGRAATVVGSGMLAMNVLAYAFVVLAAHALGPARYGSVGALLGLVLIANVGALSLQATAARRLATSPPDTLLRARRDLLRMSLVVSAGLGVILLLAVPAVDVMLQLDDWVTAAMVAPACAALTMTGAYAGLAQGERRWSALAGIYLALGVGRIAGGGVALLVDGSARSALAGVAAGSLVPLAVGWKLCRPTGPTLGRTRGQAGGQTLGLPREVWRNGHTLLAFFVVSNLDVLLARRLFSPHDAGIYAGGAILTKACLFLPTFVLVVTFPSMAAHRDRPVWRRPLLLVLGLGGVVVLAAALLPALARAFVGGSAYAGLGHVAWLFALEGTLLAAVQILVYDAIAGQAHAASLLWGGAAALTVGAVLLAHSVVALAALATLSAGAVGVAAYALMAVRTSRSRAHRVGAAA